MTNEQTSTAQEDQQLSDLDYAIGKLQRGFNARQRSLGRRQRISRLDALEVIWAILRLMSDIETDYGL